MDEIKSLKVLINLSQYIFAICVRSRKEGVASLNVAQPKVSQKLRNNTFFVEVS